MAKDDIYHRLGESNIRLEMTTQQIKEAVLKISDSNRGIEDAVKSFNDNFSILNEKLDIARNGCQVINEKEKARLWKAMTLILTTLTVVLMVLLGSEKIVPSLIKYGVIG